MPLAAGVKANIEIKHDWFHFTHKILSNLRRNQGIFADVKMRNKNHEVFNDKLYKLQYICY